MKIAMIYICTGNYDIFWDGFHSSFEKYFYPDVHKEYFVLSDSEKMNRLQDKNVHTYYQSKAGWPYDTLLRYSWICMLQDKLQEFDYCYFTNANSVAYKPIDSSVIPFPDPRRGGLVLSIHTQCYEDMDGQKSRPERNPQSLACIPEGMPCRANAGGFWGGTSEAVLKMCRELRDRVADDLNRGVIAIWHDQSHLMKYATEVPYIPIDKYVISSEEYAQKGREYIMFLNKDHFGGNDKLRNIGLGERIRHIPGKVYGACARLYRKFIPKHPEA